MSSFPFRLLRASLDRGDPDGGAGKPPGLFWDYDRAELIADAVVHGLGVLFAIAGGLVLLLVVARQEPGLEFAAVAVYAAALFLMLGCSAVYNVWPVSRAKWILRRIDHSAIYLMIAGTYTPFVAQLKATGAAVGLLGAMWLTAAAGIALKLLLPGRFDRLSIVLYLGLGWSGLLVWDAVSAGLSSTALWLLSIGGGFYSVGVIFHLWERLRFQNAIWHSFVLAAAISHYGAVFAAFHP